MNTQNRVRVFDVDPAEAEKAKKFESSDLVGRFRSGAQVNGRPMALTEWRVTTGDPDIADSIAEAFGGTPAEWETKTEENLEVYTETGSIPIVLDGPSAVKTGMVLWGRKGKVRECDGVTQKDGSACVCPQTVKERKEAAQAGSGCDPSIMIFFRLADHPELGKFRFITGSWSMLKEISKAQDALDEIGGPAEAVLKLEHVEFESNGQKRAFTKPVLLVTGPAEDVFS